MISTAAVIITTAERIMSWGTKCSRTLMATQMLWIEATTKSNSASTSSG